MMTPETFGKCCCNEPHEGTWLCPVHGSMTQNKEETRKSNNMTPEKARELMKKATPGPWVYAPTEKQFYGEHAATMIWTSQGPGYGTVAETCSCGLVCCEQEKMDAAFIAAAPDIAQAYLDTAEKLRMAMWQLKATLEHLDEFHPCVYEQVQIAVGNEEAIAKIEGGK